MVKKVCSVLFSFSLTSIAYSPRCFSFANTPQDLSHLNTALILKYHSGIQVAGVSIVSGSLGNSLFKIKYMLKFRMYVSSLYIILQVVVCDLFRRM